MQAAVAGLLAPPALLVQEALVEVVQVVINPAHKQGLLGLPILEAGAVAQVTTMVQVKTHLAAQAAQAS